MGSSACAATPIVWSRSIAPPLEVYARIRCPVLLVLATRGRYRREIVDGIPARCPQIRVAWLDCGHDVPGERPAELAPVLETFVDSL